MKFARKLTKIVQETGPTFLKRRCFDGQFSLVVDCKFEAPIFLTFEKGPGFRLLPVAQNSSVEARLHRL